MTRKARDAVTLKRQANAARQARFRDRHLMNADATPNEQRDRLNVVTSVHVPPALRRLCTHYGITQAEMLERLIVKAEREAIEALPPAEHEDYYAAKLKQKP